MTIMIIFGRNREVCSSNMAQKYSLCASCVLGSDMQRLSGQTTLGSFGEVSQTQR